MKHLILFTFLLLTFSACQKKYCYNCRHAKTSSLTDEKGMEYMRIDSVTQKLNCDMTEKAMKNYVEEYSGSESIPMGNPAGHTQTDNVVVTCEQQ